MCSVSEAHDETHSVGDDAVVDEEVLTVVRVLGVVGSSRARFDGYSNGLKDFDNEWCTRKVFIKVSLRNNVATEWFEAAVVFRRIIAKVCKEISVTAHGVPKEIRNNAQAVVFGLLMQSL